MHDTILEADIETELADLERAFAAPSFEPAVLVAEEDTAVEADWAIVAAVAAVLALALGVVIYICSVCQARSFNACYRAVINFWGRGC